MFIRRRKHLKDIARIRVAEGRDLDNGLRLDRNERVDAWPVQMLAEIFAQKPAWFLSVYPESGALYKKLARFHGLDESELLLTSGIDGGLKTLFEVATEPGDLVGTVTPTYAMYRVYPQLFQVRLEEVAYTQALSFDFPRFEALLDRDPALFFLPNPNQPVESCFSVAELEYFAKKTLEKNCLLVVDEAYHMFGSESAIGLIEKYENVVIARTFSKAFGVPSIRLGYLISNRENIGLLSKTRFAHESNALSNAVAEYLLDHYSIVEEYAERVVAAREAIKPLLDDLGIPSHGSAGNYLLLDLGDETRAKAYVADLRSKKIYVKPWAAPWARYVTITVGPMETMHRFIEATDVFYAGRI